MRQLSQVLLAFISKALLHADRIGGARYTSTPSQCAGSDSALDRSPVAIRYEGRIAGGVSAEKYSVNAEGRGTCY
jgi:hypothetical protein